jgi:hypothetical protein
VLTTIKEMSLFVSLYLDGIKKTLEYLGADWHPTILQEAPFHVFQLTYGVLWAPNSGLHVIQTLASERIWNHYTKHPAGVTLVYVEDEHAILGERFPGLEKLPR